MPCNWVKLEPEWRFWTRVAPQESGCWEWTRRICDRGYGRFSIRRNHVCAHRWSYERFVGPIPSGMVVMHRCDNKKCVRPDHLTVGTSKDNSIDMSRKGRASNGNKGKTHCRRGHPLTEGNVYWSQGKRGCRTCNLNWQRIYAARRTA